MTPEEKAKAYDEAIKKAAALYKASEPMSGCNVIIETLFPELAESEDEKIRKWIINEIKIKHHNLDEENVDFVDKAIAWLEKQGQKDILEDAILDGNEDGLIAETIRYKHEKQSKQKLDKVEPKFKVGDWIINPRTGLIKHIKNILLCDNNGNYEFESSSMSIDSVDNSFHLWTIQDVKDGDVLAFKNNICGIIICKSPTDYDTRSYCRFVSDNFINKEESGWDSTLLVPATKEQRDLLFQKMKEAGYAWDVEKRELKKINSYCQENCKGFQETGKCFADGECKAKREAEQELTDLEEFINELSKQFPDVSFAKLSRIVVRVAKWTKSNQPKQEWSEEDSYYRNHIIQIIEEINNAPLKRGEDWEAYINWLKSLKGRVQPKQEWSDVDKDILSRIIDDLKFLRDTVSIDPKYAVSIIDMEREITWLNSLRPQNKWKPSDEQMMALLYYCSNGSVLSSLYNDLKKLKEG